MDETTTDKAKVILPPPLFFVMPLAAGIALHIAFPLRFLPAGWLQLAIGVFIAIIGLAFSLTAVRTLARTRTDVVFTKATSHIVTHGPYRISRNPIYVGT